MTVFDALLAAIIGVSIFFAAVRGGVREMATLAALVVGGLAAFGLAKPIAAAAGKGEAFLVQASIGAMIGAGVFFTAYFLLHKMMNRMKLTSRMKRYDQIGGGIFGLLRALALIGLGFLGYGYYLDEANQPDAVRKALLLPLASASASFFEQFAPGNRELASAGKNANAAADGYDNRDRTGLKEIVTTVTTTEKGASSDDPIADVLTEGEKDGGEPDRH